MIVKELNISLKNAVSTLNVNGHTYTTNRASGDITDPTEKAIKKYKFHPSYSSNAKAFLKQQNFVIQSSWDKWYWKIN